MGDDVAVADSVTIERKEVRDGHSTAGIQRPVKAHAGGVPGAGDACGALPAERSAGTGLRLAELVVTIEDAVAVDGDGPVRVAGEE
jgi:hypothetical protein